MAVPPSLIDTACDVVYYYINLVYGINFDTRAAYYGKQQDAVTCLERLAAQEKAMPNVAKFGMAYTQAMAGRPWALIPESYLCLCEETASADC